MEAALPVMVEGEGAQMLAVDAKLSERNLMRMIDETGTALAEQPGFREFCVLFHEKVLKVLRNDFEGFAAFLVSDDWSKEHCKRQLQLNTDQVDDLNTLLDRFLQRQTPLLPQFALLSASYVFEISVQIVDVPR